MLRPTPEPRFGHLEGARAKEGLKELESWWPVWAALGWGLHPPFPPGCVRLRPGVGCRMCDVSRVRSSGVVAGSLGPSLLGRGWLWRFREGVPPTLLVPLPLPATPGLYITHPLDHLSSI